MIEFLQRNWKYVVYLAKHKLYVYMAGRVTGTPLWRLIIHDWSKLMPQEWFPYMNFFYPTKVQQNIESAIKYGDARYAKELAAATPDRKAAFRLAFLHHVHWNLHHWNYWVITSDDGKTRAQEIPDIYIREMVADWFGAGRGISGKWDAPHWYAQHKDMLLTPKTRRRVEELLESTAKVLY